MAPLNNCGKFDPYPVCALAKSSARIMVMLMMSIHAIQWIKRGKANSTRPSLTYLSLILKLVFWAACIELTLALERSCHNLTAICCKCYRCDDIMRLCIIYHTVLPIWNVPNPDLHWNPKTWSLLIEICNSMWSFLWATWTVWDSHAARYCGEFQS